MFMFRFIAILLFALWLTSTVCADNITFNSGDQELAATLLLPDSSLPVPGVVIVHGSGPSDRSNPWTSAYAQALVARGIAVLHPDKRGAGASEGDWKHAGLDLLADDSLAAVSYLRNHPAIDSQRIGMVGFSQGGHVVPIAASKDKSVAFAVSVSSSVVPMMEQIGDELRMMAEREGLSNSEQEIIANIHQASVDYAFSGSDWDRYSRLLDAHAEGALGKTHVFSGFPRDPDSWKWAHLQALGNADPMQYWRSVGVPVLFLYGGNDQNVDARKSVRRLLAAPGLADKNYAIQFFSLNGHALYREDAIAFLARWIHDNGAH